VYSDAVAARRSRRDIVAGKGGSRLNSRFTKRMTTRIQMAMPSGRWIDTSTWYSAGDATMATPMQSMVRTIAAIVQCSSRIKAVNCVRWVGIVIPLCVRRRA
jgi:hypothetical protein